MNSCTEARGRLFWFCFWHEDEPFRNWRDWARSFSATGEISQECIGVVARTATWRELWQFLDVSSSHNHVLRFQSGHEASNHVRHVRPPFLFAQSSVSADPDIVLKGALPPAVLRRPSRCCPPRAPLLNFQST